MPWLQVAEHPLDLGIEMPGVDLAPDVGPTPLRDGSPEPPAELATVVGHQEPRPSPTVLVGGILYRDGKILRPRPSTERLQRDDPPAVAVHDRSDLDLPPRRADRGHVEVPHATRLRRVLQLRSRMSCRISARSSGE